MKNNPRKKEQMMISAAIVVCVVVIVAGYFIKSAKHCKQAALLWDQGRVQNPASCIIKGKRINTIKI